METPEPPAVAGPETDMFGNPRRKAGQPSAAQKRARVKSLEKANRERDRIIQQKEVIKEKIRKGIPISEDEMAIATKVLGRLAKGAIKDQGKDFAETQGAIIIKPQTINALRVIIEQTAAKHKYNPIEAILADLPYLDPKDRMAMHKTLLPYLMPQLAPAKEEHVTPEPQKGTVIIKNFMIASESATPIHESKKLTVGQAVDREDQRDDKEAAAIAFEKVQETAPPLPSSEPEVLAEHDPLLPKSP